MSTSSPLTEPRLSNRVTEQLPYLDARAQVEYIHSLSDEELRIDTELLGQALDVDDDTRRMTWELHDQGIRIARRKGAGEKFGREILEGLRFGLSNLNTILDFYQIDPERAARIKAAYWSAHIISDEGKSVLPDWLIQKSEKGDEIWTNDDTDLMGLHAYFGYLIAKEKGFENLVARPVAEHHGRQIFNKEFPHITEMSDDEQFICDTLRITDSTWAAMTRCNKKYEGKPAKQRWLDVEKNIDYVFRPYDETNPARRKALVDAVYGKVLEYFPLSEELVAA